MRANSLDRKLNQFFNRLHRFGRLISSGLTARATQNQNGNGGSTAFSPANVSAGKSFRGGFIKRPTVARRRDFRLITTKSRRDTALFIISPHFCQSARVVAEKVRLYFCALASAGVAKVSSYDGNLIKREWLLILSGKLLILFFSARTANELCDSICSKSAPNCVSGSPM